MKTAFRGMEEREREIIRITDAKDPVYRIFSERSEQQLMHYYEPEPGIFLAETVAVIERALDAGYEPLAFLIEEHLIGGAAKEILCRCPEVPVYTGDASLLKEITGYALTRGVLCAMRRKPVPSVEEICAGAKRIALLENVMNPTNVGAIFRSAAAIGMDAVLLSPGCSDPLYRRAIRVSVGTVFQIPWTFLEQNPAEALLPELKEKGYRTLAMALDSQALPLDDPSLLAWDWFLIALGSEGYGLTQDTIRACDQSVMIPMAHGVDSLNVAAAGAVTFWQLCRGR